MIYCYQCPALFDRKDDRDAHVRQQHATKPRNRSKPEMASKLTRKLQRMGRFVELDIVFLQCPRLKEHDGKNHGLMPQLLIAGKEAYQK